MNYSIMSKNFYITTPIYYVNDKPHIGHAYTSLACDIMARFRRFMGDKVHFLSGTDEHGQKVAKAAQAKNISPKEFTDIVSQNFRDLPKIMDYSIDDFIRTTESRHYQSCQALWQKLLANGWIYKGDYQGWYAVRDEAYYGLDELIVKDGKHIAPSGAECEWVVEASYFFKLSAFGEKLLAYYEANPDFIQPQSRRNEVISFVKGGLNDLSISRTSFAWGVPVPNDAKHIMYVWLDALTNYLTALGFPDESSRFISTILACVHSYSRQRYCPFSCRLLARVFKWLRNCRFPIKSLPMVGGQTKDKKFQNPWVMSLTHWLWLPNMVWMPPDIS